MREPRNAGEDDATSRPPALSRPPARLKKRADFVKAARGARLHAQSFSLQVIGRKSETVAPPRFGFTVTKKLGGAVLRNRIRRRLKEALRLAPDLSACLNHDYVILGRQAALSQEFAALQEDLARAITEIHRSASVSRARTPSAAKPRRAPAGATTSLKKD